MRWMKTGRENGGKEDGWLEGKVERIGRGEEGLEEDGRRVQWMMGD